MFTHKEHLHRVLLPLTFFGVLISVLVLNDGVRSTKATTIITGSPVEELVQSPLPPENYPACETNDDCPIPTSFCNDNGQCEELVDPTCDCSQTQVLRCYQEDGHARFTFCENGCTQVEEQLICQ